MTQVVNIFENILRKKRNRDRHQLFNVLSANQFVGAVGRNVGGAAKRLAEQNVEDVKDDHFVANDFGDSGQKFATFGACNILFVNLKLFFYLFTLSKCLGAHTFINS